ncbi:unnamed protein product, partial [Rotaria sp. Silwood1]
NINLQKLFNINADDLQPISDDEIYLNQLIEPVSNKQPDYEEISNDEPDANDRIQVNNMELIINEENEFIIDDNEQNKPPEDVKEKPTKSKHKPHRLRSQASRQRRNKKRNNTHRIRRYHHHIIRSIYYKFNAPLARKILKQHDVKYVHVKVVDGTLVIGVKNNMMKQKYQDQIPENMFDRKHYEIYQHYNQHRHQHHHPYHHQHHHE